MRLLRPIAAILAVLGLLPASRAAAADVLVLAAASLTQPMTRIADDYSRATGVRVRASFAASSTLAKQIARGAPADIYISANPQWVRYLHERKAVEPASERQLLGNDLVLIVPAGSTAKVETASAIVPLIGEDRLAVADPDHVPAGIYAKASLTSLGLWKALGPRLARAADVRGALALVERAEVPAGIVYGSDASSDPRVRVVYTFGPETHPPIIYVIAVVAGRKRPEVTAFFDHLFGGEARKVFNAFGFSMD